MLAFGPVWVFSLLLLPFIALKFNPGAIMKNDSKPAIVAKVDLRKVKYKKPDSLGIDFANEIDIWAKMEFRARSQVKKLSRNESLDGHDVLQDLNSLYYSIREKLD
jgi:hypothetical protein